MYNHSFSFDAIGTYWQIDIAKRLSAAEGKLLLKKIQKRIEAFDKTYSRFRKDSLITTMAKEKGTYLFPTDAPPLLTLYQELYDLTDGAFTPLIGQVISDAGYDATYSLKSKKLISPPPLTSLTINGRKITTKEPMLIDLGAAGKGYLIDIIADLLRKERMHLFCIDAGGDILHSDPEGKAINVGLEDPNDPMKVIGVVSIANQSICGSAGNRRKWGNYHHIINAKTLSSPQDILSVWVIAKTGLLADGIATCLFFTPAEKLRKRYSFEYLILNKDLRVTYSPGFTAELFLK
ncbi:MAG: FAD:protein FMN transferase [Patescibacteria group bacterium]